MIDLNLLNHRENARLLLKGLWYAELPDLLDIDELPSDLDVIFSEINQHCVREFQQDTDDFITDWRYITSPHISVLPALKH